MKAAKKADVTKAAAAANSAVAAVVDAVETAARAVTAAVVAGVAETAVVAEAAVVADEVLDVTVVVEAAVVVADEAVPRATTEPALPLQWQCPNPAIELERVTSMSPSFLLVLGVIAILIIHDHHRGRG